MDEREKTDNAAGQSDAFPSNEGDLIRPRHNPATTQGPSSDPVRVLARMPNLESEPAAGRSSRRSQRRRRDQGRMLSAPVAVPLLVGAGVLLVAAAVLPLVLGSREKADPEAPGGPPPWAIAPAEADPQAQPDGPDTASTALPWNDSTEPVDGPAPPSCRDLPTVTADERSQTAVASWQDPGQWPYESGTGRPESAHLGAPRQYPETHGATAIETYPEALTKTAARDREAAEASRPAQVSYEGYAAPRTGMNQTMALNSSGSRLPRSSEAEANYAGGPQPASAYPETRPEGPGVARLQGVIEKPSVRTTYDYTRPGVY